MMAVTVSTGATCDFGQFLAESATGMVYFIAATLWFMILVVLGALRWDASKQSASSTRTVRVHSAALQALAQGV